MRNLLRGRDDGPKHPDVSLHSYHYAPHKKAAGRLDAQRAGCNPEGHGPSQHRVVFDSSPHLLATITLSQTGS